LLGKRKEEGLDGNGPGWVKTNVRCVKDLVIGKGNVQNTRKRDEATRQEK